jgi:hypothetical protein
VSDRPSSAASLHDVSGRMGATETDLADDVPATVRRSDPTLRAAEAAGTRCIRSSGLERAEFRFVHQLRRGPGGPPPMEPDGDPVVQGHLRAPHGAEPAGLAGRCDGEMDSGVHMVGRGG